MIWYKIQLNYSQYKKNKAMSRIHTITTKFDNPRFVHAVLEIVPEECRDWKLKTPHWAIRELERGAFYFYINFSGNLDWGFYCKSDEHYSFESISNGAFLFILRCMFARNNA